MAEPDYSKAMEVKSIEEIYEILNQKRCNRCKGEFDYEDQTTVKRDNKVYDNFLCHCSDCGHETRFIFDVTLPYSIREKLLKED